MSEVVTQLTIDADTSGADRYSEAMDRAGGAAEKGMSSAQSVGLAIAGVGVAALGAVTGVKQMLDYVASANKDLADLQTVSNQVGLSLADLQGIKFGGAISGLTDGQINSGLEKSASLLNDAQRNANSLSKELDANGISIKNANGQLISENQLLGIAADLVKRANSPGDQLAIAQMLGFTKEWIPLLQQGSGTMAGLTDEARAAGSVINDETIQRATEFDDQWRKSSVEFSTNMKAALYGLLPIVDDLIDGAIKFVKSIDPAEIQKASDEIFKNFRDATGTPDSGGIHIDTDNLSRAIQEWRDDPIFSVETWRTFGRAFSESITILKPEDLKWIDGTNASISDTSPQAFGSKVQAAGFWNDQLASLKGMTPSDRSFSGAASKVASRDSDSGATAYDRAEESLRKYIETTAAATGTIDQTTAAQERAKAMAQLVAAAMKDGLSREAATAKAQMSGLADSAAAAADALAKAKVAADIKFNRNTALLSSEDVQIATELKGLYPDVATALGSVEAQSIRVNNAMKGLSSSIESSLTSGLTDLVSGSKSAGQAFSDMSGAIIKAIEQMIIKIMIVEPLMRALQSSISGLGGGFNFASLIGGGGGTATAGLDGLAAIHHSGGIIGESGMPSRYVHPAYFDHAPRFHTGGIAGDEVPIIAKKGEGVFTPGQMAALGGGGSAPNVIINNHTDAQPQVSVGSNGDVTVTLKKAIDNGVGDSLASGAGRRVLGAQYGLKQFMGA